jgi:phenylpropionate dioxygenase-like ring-hydroxylating dioxygenase large terminal subunit
MEAKTAGTAGAVSDSEGRPLTAAEEQYPLEPHLLDARTYVDPEQYEREIEQIFYRSWLPIMPASDVASPRDIGVWDMLEQSVVVVRLDDGTLSAWHNVCQHRGARLVRDSGRCEHARIRCPWHGFSYDLEGKVIAVPLRDSFPEAELEGLRAPQIKVDEWGGFVWISLSDEVPPLREYLGAIGTLMDGYGLDDFEFRYREPVRLKANWKLVIDAFNETWHVPFTHKETLTGIVLWRDAVLHLEQPHSWMELPLRGYTERIGGDDPLKKQICHFLMFPNTIASCFPTHLQAWNAWPISPKETLLQTYGIVGPTPEGMTEEDWIKQNDRDWEHFMAVAREDSEVIDNFGTVVRSLGFKRNLFNTAESRLTAFHEEIHRRVGGPPTREVRR